MVTKAQPYKDQKSTFSNFNEMPNILEAKPKV
jgi:hypothetical protein